ncbi:hypothetical protein HJC99_03370 [Candidatus Saccharibacteria bacterium]|nr:hypothetical protein [Candidatus Saccharibacteria bacterium]
MSSQVTLPKENAPKLNPVIELARQADMDEAAIWDDFIELLKSIDAETPLAKLNESTIIDRDGERIEL